MTATASDIQRRRGACPGLSAPMPTGDGLLVRLVPAGTIALGAFAGFCAAARRHGNGVIEVTARGSIQVRGLTPSSAPMFATDVAALDIATGDGVPVLTNTLAGLDGDETMDSLALAADLRRAMTSRAIAAKVSAKVAIAIDGGGTLNLAAVPADIRLAAIPAGRVHVSLGGDSESATGLGAFALPNTVEAAVRLLEVLARHGRDARVRDFLATEGMNPFHTAIADLLDGDAPPHGARQTREAIGLHRLRDGSFACGLGLAFGHAGAETLEQLMDIAADAGATGIRAAPDRALLAIGLSQSTTDAFAAAAERLGFIVHAGDPRRHVTACAGAPICASAHIPARVIAPHIAALAAASGGTIHISGCAKGCARQQPAALTVIGTAEGCALVRDGSVRDKPFAIITVARLPSAIETMARERETGHV